MEEEDIVVGEHSDFIGVYKNLIPSEICNALIEEFERYKSLNTVYAGSTHGGVKKDIKSSIDANFMSNMTTAKYVSEHVFPLMQKAYDDYIKTYPILDSGVCPHEQNGFQVQKYEGITGGYHTFHIEAGSKETCDRVVTWMIYLNDIEEGGETEFLYQKTRVKPTEGTLLFFPCNYTHPHRGNPTLGNETKYVATGWLIFI